MSIKNWLTTHEAWCEQNITVKSTKEKGNGLYAHGDLKQDQVLARIPWDMCLCKDMLQMSPARVPTLVKALENELTERMTLVLMLLCLKCPDLMAQDAKIATFWAPYIQSLPCEMNTPLFWSSEQLNDIESTEVYHAIQSKQKALEKEYVGLSECLSQHTTATFSFNEYQWADAIFWSRCLEINHQLVLVPFIDFCNHSLEPNARWEFKDSSVQLVSHLPISSDCEITISYGDKPNSELFYLHGFVLQDNPNDAVCLPFPFQHMIPVSERILQVKMEMMRQEGLTSRITLHLPTVPCFDLDPNQGILSLKSYRMLFLALLTQEDGLDVNDQGILSYHDQPIKNTSDLIQSISSLPFLDILLLRISVLLLDIMKYHHNAYYTNQHQLSILMQDKQEMSLKRLVSLDYLTCSLHLLETATAIFTQTQTHSLTLPHVINYLD